MHISGIGRAQTLLANKKYSQQKTAIFFFFQRGKWNVRNGTFLHRVNHTAFPPITFSKNFVSSTHFQASHAHHYLNEN